MTPSRKSSKTRQKTRRRGRVLLLILILVLTASTSCQTRTRVELVDDADFRKALISALPEPPQLPQFPVLHWTYKDGLYGLSESDADKLLDFVENSYMEFSFDYAKWKEQLDIILKKIN